MFTWHIQDVLILFRGLKRSDMNELKLVYISKISIQMANIIHLSSIRISCHQNIGSMSVKGSYQWISDYYTLFLMEVDAKALTSPSNILFHQSEIKCLSNSLLALKLFNILCQSRKSLMNCKSNNRFKQSSYKSRYLVNTSIALFSLQKADVSMKCNTSKHSQKTVLDFGIQIIHRSHFFL